MAYLSVTLGTEQIINGIAIVLLAQGITAFTFEKLFGGGEQPTIHGIPDLHVPLLHDIPGVGQSCSSRTSSSISRSPWSSPSRCCSPARVSD